MDRNKNNKNNIEIITAKNCGFCFGVRKAVDMLNREIELSKVNHNKIYLLGKIIHNNLFIEDLISKGLVIIDDITINREHFDLFEFEFEENSVVIIRAHGIPRLLFEKLKYIQKQKNLKIVDATCECVKRMHEIASENTKNIKNISGESLTLIFGDSEHPEIVGLKGYVNGDVIVYKNFDELYGDFDRIKHEIFEKQYKKLIILVQTTHNIDDYIKCKNFLNSNLNANIVVGDCDCAETVCTAKPMNPIELEYFDTICGATAKRQAEAQKLSEICDYMIIVGSENSSNTKKLYEICKKNCANSFILETSERLPLNIFDLGQVAVKVGITAGASTPDSIIEEVKKIMTDNIENNKNINERAIDSENSERIEQDNQGEQSFAEMLEQTFAMLNRGDRVKGIVSYISDGEIHVDLNGKYTGLLAFDEITDDSSANLKEMFKVGDEIETQIIKINDLDGTALLSRKRIDSNDNWEKIIKFFEDGTISEGKVVQVVNGGIIVLIDSVKVFVPASHANVSKDTDLQTLVGRKVRTKIIDVNQQKRRAIASIRNAEAEERKANEDKVWGGVEIGKRYDGVVKSIANYGVFVDIGGIDGMVHITELSWSRIKHPSEVLQIGDKINVYIKDFDAEKRRISLGYKNESDNPWTKFLEEHQVGNVVDVKILTTTPFGAFAEIIPGVDGLIHISQISDKKINKPSEVLNAGDIVQVKIMEIIPESKKLSLSMRALIEPIAIENLPEVSDLSEISELGEVIEIAKADSKKSAKNDGDVEAETKSEKTDDTQDKEI